MTFLTAFSLPYKGELITQRRAYELGFLLLHCCYYCYYYYYYYCCCYYY